MPGAELATGSRRTCVEHDVSTSGGFRTWLRAWLGRGLRDLAYAAAVLAWSIVGFCVLATGLSVTAPLLVLVVGVFVWFGFVYAVRWTTAVDRALAGWQRRQPVRGQYRRSRSRTWVEALTTTSSDPQTWRDLGWLSLNSVVGFAFGLFVLTTASLVVGWVSMPLWFWAVDQPQDQLGVTNLGVLTVDTLGEAALTSVAGLALIPVVLALTRSCAGAHARLASHLLGTTPPVAPLTERNHHA